MLESVPSSLSRYLLFALAGSAVCLLPLLFGEPKPFRVYPALEGYDDLALPPDYERKANFVLGRLMYTAGAGRGGRGSNWTVDYPKGDRALATVLTRLTRIDVRSVEQPVNPDDGDDIFYWPYLHVGMPGSWNLNEAQAGKIRDYLLRGGFLVCDSFFGTEEWKGFENGMRKIFPTREIEPIPDGDPVFRLVYDIQDRYQVANYRSMQRDGRTYRADGAEPKFLGIRDDHGRLMVVMAFNNDMGDSWQLADEPRYPEKYSALGIRLGVNFVTYALSH